MPTKSGLHVVSGSRNGYGQVIGMACVLAVNEGGALIEAKNNWQNTITIFRVTEPSPFYLEAPEDFDNWNASQAIAHADWIYPHFKQKWQLNPANYHVVLNEPFNEQDNIDVYLAYERRLIDLAFADGFRICMLNLAGGSPSMTTWKSQVVPHLEYGFSKGAIYGRHAYGGDLVPLDGNTSRPLQEAKYLQSIGLHGGIVITELGIDGGYGYSPQRFMAQMPIYDEYCQNYSNIIGFCWWTLGDWNSQPEKGNSNYQDSMAWYSEYVGNNPSEEWNPDETTPPIEPPIPPNTSIIYEQYFNNGWYDRNASQQIPNGTHFWEKLGHNPFVTDGSGDSWNALVPCETRILTADYLPEHEHELFLNEYGHTYKTFKGNLPFWCRLWTEVEIAEAGKYRLELDFVGDWYEWINNAKVPPNEPDHARIELFVNSDGFMTWHDVNMLGNNLIVAEFELDKGFYNFGYGVLSVWGADNNGCFIRSFRVVRVGDSQPPINPLPPSKESIIKMQSIIKGISNNPLVKQLAQDTIDMVYVLDDCEELPPIPPDSKDFYIIDISKWQNNPDWQYLIDKGVVGVYIKMSQGTTTDYMADTHYRSAKDNGLKVGFYHYLDVRVGIDEQAMHFADCISLYDYDMPLAVDVEENQYSPLPTSEQVRQFVEQTIPLDDRMVMYTSAYYYNRVSTTDNFGCELWVAHYGATTPTLPKAFNVWYLHQFTSSGFEAGQSLDVNRFNGSLENYHSWLLDDNTLPPIEPPEGEPIDIWSYFMPERDNVTYEVRHSDGSQERIQNQIESSNHLYIVKGENQGYYEYWYATGSHLYLTLDTSPANDSQGNRRYYQVDAGRWCKRFMRVGEWFNDGGHFVQFYAKSDCRKLDENSGHAENNTLLIAHYDTVNFDTGITVHDCIEIGNPDGERHIFAKGIGRVAWYSAWGKSEISELHGYGTRPVIEREVIGCM